MVDAIEINILLIKRLMILQILAEKNGVKPSDAVNLYRFVLEKCENLYCEGVMTIGAFGHDYSKGPNPDFIELMKCHEEICRTFEKSPDEVQVSMGMSDDFEKAVSKI